MPTRRRKSCKHGKLKKSVKTKKGGKRKCKKKLGKKRTKKCAKGRLKKPTKSGRVCRKRRKSTNRPYMRVPSNCVGLDENTCNADPNCQYRRGRKNRPHCAARSGGYGSYEGPMNRPGGGGA